MYLYIETKILLIQNAIFFGEIWFNTLNFLLNMYYLSCSISTLIYMNHIYYLHLSPHKGYFILICKLGEFTDPTLRGPWIVLSFPSKMISWTQTKSSFSNSSLLETTLFLSTTEMEGQCLTNQKFIFKDPLTLTVKVNAAMLPRYGSD